jgi:PAN domain
MRVSVKRASIGAAVLCVGLSSAPLRAAECDRVAIETLFKSLDNVAGYSVATIKQGSAPSTATYAHPGSAEFSQKDGLYIKMENGRATQGRGSAAAEIPFDAQIWSEVHKLPFTLLEGVASDYRCEPGKAKEYFRVAGDQKTSVIFSSTGRLRHIQKIKIGEKLPNVTVNFFQIAFANGPVSREVPKPGAPAAAAPAVADPAPNVMVSKPEAKAEPDANQPKEPIMAPKQAAVSKPVAEPPADPVTKPVAKPPVPAKPIVAAKPAPDIRAPAAKEIKAPRTASVAKAERPVARPAPPPAPLARFERAQNRYFVGGGYAKAVAPGPDQCLVRCSQDRQCLGFEFYRPEQACILYARLPEDGPSSVAEIGVRMEGPRSARRLDVARFQRAQNTYFVGGGYAKAVTPGPDQCLARCSYDRQCRAFEFFRPESACILYARVPQAGPSRAAEIGIRQ